MYGWLKFLFLVKENYFQIYWKNFSFSHKLPIFKKYQFKDRLLPSEPAYSPRVSFYLIPLSTAFKKLSERILDPFSKTTFLKSEFLVSMNITSKFFLQIKLWAWNSPIFGHFSFFFLENCPALSEILGSIQKIWLWKAHLLKRLRLNVSGTMVDGPRKLWIQRFF